MIFFYFYKKETNKVNLNADAKPFQRAYGSKHFEKRKSHKKIMVDLEKGNLVEPTHSNWAAPFVLVKKRRIPQISS